jgi:hypothetical protein
MKTKSNQADIKAVEEPEKAAIEETPKAAPAEPAQNATPPATVEDTKEPVIEIHDAVPPQTAAATVAETPKEPEEVTKET